MEYTEVNCTQCGLVVNSKHPFLGASPDAWVTCSCHSNSLIEVQCPYRCQDSSLEQLALTTKDFCLKEDGNYSLDDNIPTFNVS